VLLCGSVTVLSAAGAPSKSPSPASGAPANDAVPGSDSNPIIPTDAVTLPVLVTKVEPVYPEQARRKGLEGNVTLEAAILKDGTVGNVTVLAASNPMFRDAVLEAVRQWTYTPAVMDGKPVAVYLTIRVGFRLVGGRRHRALR
jgi:TonB family protein